MTNFENVLIEFEKYLDGKFWTFEKYEIDGSYLYDIRETVVVLVESKTEFSREHILFKELLNIKDEKNYASVDIKIRPFCSKYVKDWVTFYPFKGEISDDLKSIDEKMPDLKLLERYEKWEGYRIVFAGLQLENNGEKGYALIKCNGILGITELREMAEVFLMAYIDFIIKNPDIHPENEDVTRTKIGKYEFLIDKTMSKILNERYIQKYSFQALIKMKEIADIKGFWGSVYSKQRNELPLEIFDNLRNGKTDDIGVINDIYTESMKAQIPNPDDFDKEYYYLSVLYADNLNSLGECYNYLSNDKSVKKGDIVLVNRAGEDVIAVVVDAKTYLGIDVPFPVQKTKTIIKKIENAEELAKYGYKFEDFADFIEPDDDDNNDSLSIYFIVTTLCDKEEIANKISKTLMEQRLVAGSQIYKVKSDYWWGGKIESKEEFKLEFRTRIDKVSEIIEIIKSIHDYQVPAISATQIICLTDEMKNWIDESIKN